jgi:16S rRNA (cytosine967-C5)-methyltransferase
MTWPDDAARLSYPQWIYDRLCVELGEDAHAAMTRMNEAPPVTDRGDGYMQDLSSQWVAASVGAVSGERVLDVCAAPGGKATALAACGAYVLAADRSIGRAGLMHRNVRALGADVGLAVADGASSPWASGSFDRVLLDAPCSGLGALRRRPDARWRIEATDIDDLAALQRSLLAEAARVVRPGGTLVYSVCTVTAAESTDHPMPDGFEVVSTPPSAGIWRPFGHGWRVLPHDADTDGMTLIVLRRHRSSISTIGAPSALG